MVVEEVSVAHEHWQPTMQLLEYEDGSLGVRFCFYSPTGRFRRSPAIWMEEDFDTFAEVLEEAPRLQALVQRMAGNQTPPSPSTETSA